MIDLVVDALELQNYFEEMDWQFCFIGGLALQIWGQQRLTRDIDLTLFTGFLNEDDFVDRLLNKYRGRVSDAKKFALTKRVLLLETANKIGIDIALGGFPFEQDVIERSRYQSFTPEISLRTCSAEDLIIFKAIASRDQDWIDVESIIIKQDNLDWILIESNLASFAEILDSDFRLNRLRELRDRFSPG
jgi:hypothetical protein